MAVTDRATDAEVVEAPAGRMTGLQHDRHRAYLGIPFAKAPTGETRFCPPQAIEPWDGVRDASEFGFSSIQTSSNIPGMAAEGPLDEDCLCLNVFTPKADDAKRPVLFWIHGGGFTLGSAVSALYDGGPLAERGDAVVVTINYRLGALGYVWLGDHGGRDWGHSANNGQLDMISALEWVRENISAFGGDAGNVTIFGESAGSAAVATLLAMPAAKGLFHKAIMESGSGRGQPTDQAGTLSEAFLAEFGLKSADQAALMAKSADEILQAQIQSSRKVAGPRRGASYSPVMDGDTLPHIPLDAIKSGYSADIPVMIGSNRDETRLFSRMANPSPDPISDEELQQSIGLILPEHAASQVGNLIDIYRRTRTAADLPHDNNDLVDAVRSDSQFRIPGTRWASAQKTHQSDTYVYYFTWESPARRGALGACHALEMPFVFGTLHTPTQDRFAGKGPDASRLEGNMMDAWLHFARTGNPSHDGIGDWAPWNDQDRPTMIFNAESKLEDAPADEEWSAWNDIT